jgi:hypothetical protein
MPKPLNLTGQMFGDLLVLSNGPNRRTAGAGQSIRTWNCRCTVCGAILRADTRALTSGNTTNCGCRKVERTRAMGRANKTHGEASGGKTSVEYKCMSRALHDCTNPTAKGYHNYGGRGVEFQFASVAEAVQWIVENLGRRPTPRHSIDRIDNSDHYRAGNLRWATPKQQARNTRRNVIHSQEHADFILGCDAEGWPASMIVKSQGVGKHAVYHILNRGTWQSEECVSVS